MNALDFATYEFISLRVAQDIVPKQLFNVLSSFCATLPDAKGQSIMKSAAVTASDGVLDNWIKLNKIGKLPTPPPDHIRSWLFERNIPADQLDKSVDLLLKRWKEIESGEVVIENTDEQKRRFKEILAAL